MGAYPQYMPNDYWLKGEIRRLEQEIAEARRLGTLGEALTPRVAELETGKAALVHAHAAADITSGTLALARIPTGTTGATVALGNHGHTFSLAAKNAADLPSTYPTGVSVMSVTATQVGWPATTATVVTHRVGSSRTTQMVTESNTGLTFTRAENTDTWGAWRPSSAALPDGQVVAQAAATNNVTATAWATVPGLTALSVTVAYPCWVSAALQGWVNSVTDCRMGIDVSGATTQPPNGPNWGAVYYSGANNYRQGIAQKMVKINAGTTTFTPQAYRSGSGTDQINYAFMSVVPVRWAT